MKCRLCFSQTKIISTINNTHKNVSILYKEKNTLIDNELKLEIFYCQNCNHYQIMDFTANDYYEEYLMSTSFSSAIDDLVDYELRQITHYLNNRKFNRILEIGSGDGHFLLKASKYFLEQIGFEPSKPFMAISNRGSKILNEYFDPNKEYDSILNCDAFVSRQVFEHISNPFEILTAIYKYLNNGGVGLIEVPNGLKIIEESRYYEIFNDHLNYFTPNSLSMLIHKAGYELLSLETSFNHDYLIVIFRKPRLAEDYFFGVDANLPIKKLLSLNKSSKKLAIFGMGAKGQQIFSRIKDKIRIYKVFDNDRHKVGMYPANSDCIIEYPSLESLVEVDIILITAMSYKHEIINQLKNEFDFTGEIIIWEEI
jgi:SAM-dependent methyltransferase